MKMMFLQPEAGRYDFTVADKVVAWARDHGKKVRGHALIWGFQNPSWLSHGHGPLLPYSRDELLGIMRGHITTVMQHYANEFPGVVREWDVVNEAFDVDGRFARNVWAEGIGPDYVEKAFQYAREADPKARLFYNETGTEIPGTRRDATVAMVAGFRERGVPIDGVGIQTHVGTSATRPTPTSSASSWRSTRSSASTSR